MIKKIARGILLSVLILGIGCVAIAQVKESIPNYKTIGDSMKTMEGALEKALDNARISSAYVPGFGSIFVCEIIFKSDLGKLDEKALQLVKALGPLIEIEEDENICVIIKYGGTFTEEHEYMIIALKMNVSEPDKWKTFSSEMRIAKQPEEEKEKTKEKISNFSTPVNTVKTLMESMVFGDKELAEQCFSNRLPALMVSIYITTAIEKFRETFDEEKKDKPRFTKSDILGTRSYEKEKIDDNSFYVWEVNLDTAERIDKHCFRVELEEDEWKVLAPKNVEREWLERIEVIEQMTQPFFDLSTPENTVKSFIEATVLKENKKAVECWSKELPKFLVELLIAKIQESFGEIMQGAELKGIWQDPEMLKFVMGIMFSYEKEKIGEDTYYVWTFANEDKNDDPYRVIKEDGKWKIRTLKSLEDNTIFGIQEKE